MPSPPPPASAETPKPAPAPTTAEKKAQEKELAKEQAKEKAKEAAIEKEKKKKAAAEKKEKSEKMAKEPPEPKVERSELKNPKLPADDKGPRAIGFITKCLDNYDRCIAYVNELAQKIPSGDVSADRKRPTGNRRKSPEVHHAPARNSRSSREPRGDRSAVCDLSLQTRSVRANGGQEEIMITRAERVSVEFIVQQDAKRLTGNVLREGRWKGILRETREVAGRIWRELLHAVTI